MVSLYFQLAESQRSKCWEETIINISEKERKFLVRVLHKLLRKTTTTKKVVELFFKLDDAFLLNQKDMWTAANLLLELTKNVVPRFNKNTNLQEIRFVFFNEAEVWGNLLPPQLQVLWSNDDRVALFYYYGLAQSFSLWAEAFQLQLAQKLDKMKDEIVVIVTSIRLISEELLKFLEGERDRIWKNLIIDQDR